MAKIFNVCKGIWKTNKAEIIFIPIGLFLLIMICLCNDILEEHSNTLIAAITTVYAYTTVKIFIANSKSADAALAQVEEMKRQFEESRRLELFPLLQFKIAPKSEPSHADISLRLLDCDDFVQTTPLLLSVSMENYGFGIATNLNFYWKNMSGTTGGYEFPFHALYSKEHHEFVVEILIPYSEIEPIPSRINTTLRVEYQDLLNHWYCQDVSIILSKNSSGKICYDFFSVSNAKYSYTMDCSAGYPWQIKNECVMGDHIQSESAN